MKTNNTYLHFVAYKGIGRWDIKSYLASQYASPFTMVSLGQYIKEESDKYRISDKNTMYGILGVNNQVGIFDAYEECGSKINQKYKRMEAGWIAYNPYRVNVGSIGIKRETHQYEYISPAYVVFSCKEGLLPEYLFMLMKTPTFNKIIRENTTGSVRQNLSFDILSNIQIPLPSLAEQQALVDAYNHNLQQATELEQQAENGEKEIESNFADTLGIIKYSPQIFDGKYKLLFANYAQISQWGVDFILHGSKEIRSSKYPCKSIETLCKISSGGTPNRGCKDYFGGNIPWIKTGELRNEILTDTEEKITKAGMENSSAKLYPKGSLAIAMYGATIGKTAKLGIDATTNQACAVLTRINEDVVLTDYLWLYLQTQTDNLKAMAYGGAQPNINAGIIATYKIPLPPLDIQAKIVAEVQAQRAKIAECKTTAVTLRQEAITQFEQAIFE